MKLTTGQKQAQTKAREINRDTAFEKEFMRAYLGSKSIASSFKHAVNGLKYALGSQRNLRLHLLMGIAAGLLGIVLGVSVGEMAVLSASIIFVIVCEVMNTAVELSMDFVNGYTYHPSVKMVKDIAAGAVLLAAFNALMIGVVIFLKYLLKLI